ncbi:hypothetical protein IE53DRAFT_336522 [Violaceomyces palustris]|uniref:Uncharacterized protein n=1 Tax=Violaceomyces palustris TaxID=1673888 RepID=A0ACD0NLS2_9BASI|nr:hypothetical protein IE53DRAFT_336522 [Violaceomyces palustris]
MDIPSRVNLNPPSYPSSSSTSYLSSQQHQHQSTSLTASIASSSVHPQTQHEILNQSERSSNKRSTNRAKSSSRPQNKERDRHALALRSIRDFLKGRSSYDVLPVSFRLIVLDTKLVVKPALDVMWQAGVVSAPLWQSTEPGTDSAPPTTGQEPSSEASLVQPSLDPASRLPGDGREEASPTSLPLEPIHEAQAHVNVEPSNLPVKKPSQPGFAGMLTVNDIIHLIQYYYKNSNYDNAAKDVDGFRLERLRDIEDTLHVPPPPLLSVHPLRPLYDACQLLIKTHARRLPLLDYDEQTGMETVVSVLTQYRVLKFIAMNCRETAALCRSIRSLGIGTYVSSVRTGKGSNSGSSHRGSDASEPGILRSTHGSILSTADADEETEMSATEPAPPTPSGLGLAGTLSQRPSESPIIEGEPLITSPDQTTPVGEAQPTNPYAPLSTATLDTTVFDVVHMFSEKGISAVPILDETGMVVDMYETVDVITLVRTGAYQSLDLTIRQALERRPADFGGIYCCSPEDSLANVFTLLRRRRVHRLLILEPEPNLPTDADREGLPGATSKTLEEQLEAGEPRRRPKGKLAGILCLSDVLRYVIGASGDGIDEGGKRRSASGTERGSSRTRSKGSNRTRTASGPAVNAGQVVQSEAKGSAPSESTTCVGGEERASQDQIGRSEVESEVPSGHYIDGSNQGGARDAPGKATTATDPSVPATLEKEPPIDQASSRPCPPPTIEVDTTMAGSENQKTLPLVVERSGEKEEDPLERSNPSSNKTSFKKPFDPDATPTRADFA